jgi:2-methylcitrate dehydratase PrpD
VKRIHPGKAARDGLLCAEFAKRGITGPGKVLEGRYGFADTHAGGEFKWERLLKQLGSRWEIAGIYFKPYPCCRHYHSAIDGIIALRDEHGIRPQDVESLRIGLYAVGVNGHDHKHCDNILDAQMSAPVGAALALVDGEIGAHQFLPESLARPEVKRVIGISDTQLDPECERLYPGRRSGAVEIGLKGGKKVSARVLDPRGEGENPMSDADLERKFVANCEPLIGRSRCDEVLRTVWSFEKAQDAGALLRLLA